MRILLALVVSIFVIPAHAAGTSPGIDVIIQGRCLDRTQNHPYFQALARGGLTFNCTAIYDAFAGAYANVPPTTINETSFANFLDLTWHPIPENASMFWTGSSYVTIPTAQGDVVRDVVHEVSANGNRFFTLEDSLWGYLINSLTACGSTDQSVSVFNMTACPSYGAPGSIAPFWNAASAQFASLAHGDAYFLGFASSNFTSYCEDGGAGSTNVTLTCGASQIVSSISLTAIAATNTASSCTAVTAANSCTSEEFKNAVDACIGKYSCTVKAAGACTLAGSSSRVFVKYTCEGPRMIYRTGASASVFAAVEIFNINATNIRSFNALIITNDKFPTESCVEGSVAQMVNDLQFEQGGPKLSSDQIRCVNNHDIPRHTICTDGQPWANVLCKFSNGGEASEALTNPEAGVVGGAIGFVLGLLALALFCFLRKGK